ncbi:MAG TPA: hypothetical protein VGI10_07860 [Polyangiaceae bacterium]
MRRAFLLGCAALALGCLVPTRVHAALSETPFGRPKVKLDRLDFPSEIAESKELEAHLRLTLKREARRADWGAGRQSRISYRFSVKELDLREEAGVLHVTCTALGRLPKGKSAKSHIVFGGDPRERRKVVEHVLEIVARGVVARLAELERVRRASL